MYELIMVSEKTGYINCPVKMGVFLESPQKAVLIDSGIDKDSAKKVLKTLSENNLELSKVLSTHLHADHIGGNSTLLSRTDAKIYGEGIIKALGQYPILESAFLYGGYPFKVIRNKFLMANGCKVEEITENNLPAGLEVIRLDGHSIAMIGFKTSDDVIFIADALSSEETINKYHVNFQFDIKKALETLEFIETLKAKLFIPSHAEPCEDVKDLVKINRAKIEEIISLLCEICKEEKRTDDILHTVFEHYKISMDMNQYLLVGSTIKSYLSYLIDEGKMTAFTEDNYLFYKTL